MTDDNHSYSMIVLHIRNHGEVIFIVPNNHPKNLELIGIAKPKIVLRPIYQVAIKIPRMIQK